MIRKSVETRDWLNTIEPRNIRSVMKRVVEEVTLIDRQVGTLYEDGLKKEQGSGPSVIIINNTTAVLSSGTPLVQPRQKYTLLVNHQAITSHPNSLDAHLLINYALTCLIKAATIS